MLGQWRVWIQPVIMILYALILIVVIPFIVNNTINNGFSASDQSIVIGGVFVMMSLPISFWDITQHLAHFTKPYLQKHIVRILWMVPIYAVNAWVGLVFPSASIYFDSIRECYEAYVIYNFMRYLLNYLQNEIDDYEMSLHNKTQVNHFFPLCFLPPRENGADLFHFCKHGILQYVVVRPLSTFVSFVCEINDVYGEGDFTFTRAWPYLMLVNNFSQFVAMYCLVLFYRANHEELQPMRPLGKFLCIKAVVFFSFFQGVIITILVYVGVVAAVFGTTDKQSTKEVSSNMQNFLICIEMFLAAIAHHFTFPHAPFVDAESEQRSCCESFLHMWDVSDVQQDIQEHFGVVGNSLSRRIRGTTAYQPIGERSRLIYASASDSDTSYGHASGSATEEPAVPYYHSLA
ncbi:Hypothetical predicted protein [Cloeon dipterum]|uniref:Transmembrane protein 184C n=1 Tax=Cloeon dipterum TaxID=197152 RepID=A0A8S1DFF0_9INSE|nr:Hypothetical predicted protein [Cloeon dipterum]